MSKKFISTRWLVGIALLTIICLSVRLRWDNPRSLADWHSWGQLRWDSLSAPIADWHSWRQADTAAVARNFIKFGFDPLRPRYDDLSNIQSGKDNPEGYRMVEFPLYQLGAASLYRTFPQIPIEVWLRFLSILASTGTAVLLVYIVARYTDAFHGIIAGFLYAVLPYNIYYGRAILPDIPMVFFAIASVTCLVRSNDTFAGGRLRSVFWLAFASFLGASALLVKPVAAFLLLPGIYLFFQGFGFSRQFFIRLFLYSFICLLPLWAWRQWIQHFPEGIPVYLWLFNGGNIRFKGAWFYWIFAKRIGELILGFWGLIPLGFGIVALRQKKEGLFFYWWLVGSLVYLIVLARGNVQHDYYQILIIPSIVIFLAKGIVYALRQTSFSHMTPIIVVVMSFLFLMSFSWYTVRTYYWINHPEVVEAGRAADRLLPKNAKVIASYNGDTTFLYQTNRQGWPIGFEIDKKIKMGATAYVTVSPTDADGETKDLASRYRVLVRNDRYAIIDLTTKK